MTNTETTECIAALRNTMELAVKLGNEWPEHFERSREEYRKAKEELEEIEAITGTTHAYSVDLDSCVCGGEIVYFDTAERTGYGCTNAGGPRYECCDGTPELVHDASYCEEIDD